MIPTMKLRFIEREFYMPVKGNEYFAETKKVRILQQWYVYSDAECYKRAAKGDLRTGEWVDVSLEEEEKNG